MSTVGEQLRCKECGQYAPDRCVCGVDYVEWTDSHSPPKKDGNYLWRMDSCDEEDEYDAIEIKNGSPYKNGKRQIMYGGQWKAN